ncbi:MYND domain protein [Penicillium mononematosum]|uniref:MYND domain protein n=1 Tax=Penicillium mononematosum TaxID=268346 RepID=UPI002546E6A9|nr:MYND domain protein [Penicillium mononematosum]KAJ6190467.1 MYND domain protein [Penicillium mononematosum]
MAGIMQRETQRKGLLPPWWSIEKEKECVDFGLGEGSWKDRHVSDQEHQVLGTYGENSANTPPNASVC